MFHYTQLVADLIWQEPAVFEHRRSLASRLLCLSAGGPSGGNGGAGGNVWAVADEALNSLTSFRKQLHYRAALGSPGGGSNRHGANAPDLEVRVRAAVPRHILRSTTMCMTCLLADIVAC